MDSKAQIRAVKTEEAVEHELVLPRQAKMWKTLTIASLVTNAAMLVAFIIGCVYLSHKLSEAAVLTDRIATLTTEVKESREEVITLRQFVSTKTAEDVIFLKMLWLKPRININLANTIAKHVYNYSKQYSRDPDLVLSIMAVESDFNPNAVSDKGAVGLMQVMPLWKKSLGITSDLTDPETSIKYGLQILAFYEEMYKNLDLALTAYNRGPGTVDSMLMRGMDPHNDYGPSIMKVYDKLRKIRTNG